MHNRDCFSRLVGEATSGLNKIEQPMSTQRSVNARGSLIADCNIDVTNHQREADKF
jgi:hypothetical protein